MKYLMITSMRNEAPYILEWLAHHQSIGVDGFLIYSNDCEDGTDAMLDRLDALGVITHVRNDKITQAGVQWSALKRADKHPMRADAQWILFADVDEFVNVKVGGGHLDDLLAAVPDATAFALTWRMYGNNGRVNIEDGLVLEQFTKCARFPCYAPITSSMFKTLFKNDGSYEKLGVHRPKKRIEKDAGKIQWVNGSGEPLGAEYLDKATVTYGANGGIDLVCLNHYSVKSAKAFLAKTQRGLPNRSDKQLDLGYWVDRNFNQVEDVTIQRSLTETKNKISDWLADDQLGEFHRSGLAWHQNCAQKVLDDMEGVRLFTRISSLTRSDLNPRFAASLAQMMVAARRKGKDA
jgi:glycosyl transferase family 2